MPSVLPSEASSSARPPAAAAGGTATPAGSTGSLISAAARDLEDYQRLTSEGKLGEAGQKLEALKSKLERLVRQQP